MMGTETTTAAANGNAANGKAPATAIEKAKPTAMDYLKGGFEKWRPTLKAILPKHIDPERVINIAMNVYMNRPELHLCTPASMVKATMQCAELGLEPSPLLGECAFIPFKGKKRVRDGNVYKETEELQVQLIPMFAGLIKLAKQSGEISDVYAVVVDESEKSPEFDEHGKFVAGFYVEEGTTRRIQHIRRMEGRTGVLFAVYGVVKFKDGTCHYEVLSRQDVDAVRKRSKSSDNGPWVTDYEEMAKKTAIKRTLKTVPKSPTKPQLAMAIAADNASETAEAFSTDLTASIDAEGTEVQGPQTRTEQLAQRLGHDPVTGEVKS
jgi:recombination protein RecT